MRSQLDHQIALRAAIGATRGRIVRQLVTETTLLVGIAGALGLVVGVIGVRTLLAIDPGTIPRIGPQVASVTPDWRVFVFTLGTTSRVEYADSAPEPRLDVRTKGRPEAGP